jgi:hypothetical protein
MGKQVFDGKNVFNIAQKCLLLCSKRTVNTLYQNVSRPLLTGLIYMLLLPEGQTSKVW